MSTSSSSLKCTPWDSAVAPSANKESSLSPPSTSSWVALAESDVVRILEAVGCLTDLKATIL